ncbi:MAG: MAPEG family protein [Gammaproteobacteria bacterium]
MNLTDNPMLLPIIVLVLWHFVIFIWMYATRIPAMAAAKIDAQQAAHASSLDTLPAKVRQIADNYNHLFEQPVLFYVLMLAVALVGLADTLICYAAWAFVGGRIVHSLIQCTYNLVMHRFSVFMLCWVFLGVIAVRTAMALI